MMKELTRLVSKIRSTWAKATCRCEVDKLRFVRKIHGGEINIVYGNRYEYQCAVCGKMVYKERPITCEGCRYIASDKFGSILCSREYEDFCLLANREYWTEREVKQMALIDQQEAVQGVKELFSLGDCYCDEYSIVGMLNSLPTQKIIRCKECKNWNLQVGNVKGDGLGSCDFHNVNLVTGEGFCYWADRRGEADG